ncbi:restriction endonuclease subunit S [Paenibacillus sepulcri]|uniref:Restriction endonuclease subunit S n=1 Tax=Paenibacillus sepulcri TaxID=359917 RepID=A0ABS7BYK5_9BACL|nr:restriction endonuclease subunit S [Paenibacillus sepulcri]
MTENKQKLVPAIRFNGFTDTWEQRELGEVVQIKDSARVPNELWAKSGVRYLRSSDLENSGRDGALFISIGAYEDYKSKTGAPERGDVLFNSGGKIGLSLLKTDDTPVYVQGGAILYARTSQSKDVEGGYLNVYFSTHRMTKYIDISSAGGTIKHFTLKPANAAPFIFPNVIEQRKISEFFTELDHLITLHQRKLDGLVTLKDGFLQQMFPAANEVMPRVRFAGFTGNWEERRLEEMLTERNEQFEESEDYPLMSFVGNVGVVPKGEQYDRSFLVKGDGKKYKKTELNDFIYSSNNLETGSIGFNRTGKAVISPVYSIFYSSNDSESLFVGLLSKRKDFINKMIHYRQGVMYGQWRIHERDFLKIIVLAPTISEQNRIIDFFKNFDEQIAAQTAKLEQLRQLKAAYLQRMFI